jgi:hypothetical protein
MTLVVRRASPAIPIAFLVLGGAGSKSSRMNIVKGQYEPTGQAEIEGRELGWHRPALTENDWMLSDLRPVRSGYLRRRSVGLTPIQDRFLQAYDAIVVLTGSTPSAVLPVRFRG